MILLASGLSIILWKKNKIKECGFLVKLGQSFFSIFFSFFFTKCFFSNILAVWTDRQTNISALLATLRTGIYAVINFLLTLQIFFFW